MARLDLDHFEGVWKMVKFLGDTWPPTIRIGKETAGDGHRYALLNPLSAGETFGESLVWDETLALFIGYPGSPRMCQGRHVYYKDGEKLISFPIYSPVYEATRLVYVREGSPAPQVDGSLLGRAERVQKAVKEVTGKHFIVEH